MNLLNFVYFDGQQKNLKNTLSFLPKKSSAALITTAMCGLGFLFRDVGAASLAFLTPSLSYSHPSQLFVQTDNRFYTWLAKDDDI